MLIPPRRPTCRLEAYLVVDPAGVDPDPTVKKNPDPDPGPVLVVKMINYQDISRQGGGSGLS